MCHGERATAEVAPQNRQSRQSGIPLSEARTVREARSGRVFEAGRGEEESGEQRDGGMMDTPCTKYKEKEGGCGG